MLSMFGFYDFIHHYRCDEHRLELSLEFCELLHDTIRQLHMDSSDLEINPILCRWVEATANLLDE